MSRVPQRYVVFGFSTTHDALDAEAALGSAGVRAVPVPAPAALSAKCGIALRLPPDEERRARSVLAAAGIAPSARIEIDDV